MEFALTTAKAFGREDQALRMHYPDFVYRVLREEGHSTEVLLAGTKLTDKLLKDPNHRFSYASLYRLTLNALHAAGDPHLGIRLGRRFEATYVGLPAYTAMNAAHFRDALRVLSRFFFMTFPTMEFFVVDECGHPDQVEVQLRPKFPLEEIEYFMSSFALVACDGLFRAILRRPDVTLHGQMMAQEPADWQTVSTRIDFPISFGAGEIRLFLPTDLLDLPLPGADPINHARLLALCEQSAVHIVEGATPVGLVVAYLEENWNSNVSLSEAAAELGFSERGLRRQLKRSGTSFRALSDQVRFSRAKEMLLKTKKSVSTVAYELGYDSPSNFARSFKRWSGVTPKAFREEGASVEPVGRK
jgi:AraC-like DNA-binding protein